MARRSESLGYFTLILFGLIFMLSMLLLVRKSYSPERMPDDIPKSPSTSQQWSAGSAFFTITALCSGYFTQPPGSLLFSKSGRVWRLSPLYVLADTIAIFCLWINAEKRIHQLHRNRPSFRVVAVSMIVMRIRNDREVLKHTSAVKEYMLYNDRRDTSTAFVDMKSTPIDKEDDDSIDRLFEDVKRFESETWLRVFVWGNMLLQLIKLLVVHGSLLTRTIGVVFFLSWVVNDVLLISASSGSLSSMEASQASLIVDHGNPHALQLKTGSYLKILRYGAFAAQIGISLFLATAFTLGEWYNRTEIDYLWLRMIYVTLVSFGAYHFYLFTIDFVREFHRGGGAIKKLEFFSEGVAAHTALADWVLRLLCFLAVAPMQSFHDVKNTKYKAALLV